MIRLKNHKKLVRHLGLEGAGFLLLLLEKAKKDIDADSYKDIYFNSNPEYVSFEYKPNIERIMKDSGLTPDDIERLMKKLIDKEFLVYQKGEILYHLDIENISKFLYDLQDFFEML